jgi:hypothetical protein
MPGRTNNPEEIMAPEAIEKRSNSPSLRLSFSEDCCIEVHEDSNDIKALIKKSV